MNEEISESDLTFIQNPTPERLQQATALNHLDWMNLCARVAGGEVRQQNGVTWTYVPGPNSSGMISFPQLTEENAGEQLDTIVRYYRERAAEKLIGCWSLEPPQPRDLGIRLLARGFQLGWRPHWMWLDFKKMNIEHSKPANLKIEIVEEQPVWDVEDLPYYSKEEAARLNTSTVSSPRRWWHFAAWLEGKVVGHSTLFLTTGELGVAGIYSCGVVPAARGKGIGKAVTLAVCQQAQAMGCPGAMLNATSAGELMYRSIGFESVGYGRTWWLNVERLEAFALTETQIAMSEAVGVGNLDALDVLSERVESGAFDTTIPNGMTLIELAIHANQLRSVEWLVKHGATLDVISAWGLGWNDRVPKLLRDSPELANWHSEKDGMTPLHIAAIRNDIELARVVLAAHPDLSIDNNDAGTPLHQACWFGHTDVVELLLKHQPPLEVTNRYGGTPLTTAIYGAIHCRNPVGNYPAVVEALIAAGASIPVDRIPTGNAGIDQVLRRHDSKG